MPLGAMAARAAGSSDPGAMLRGLGLGVSGVVLMTVATVTTNFVNIYLSSLALRSLAPRVGEQTTVWSTGLVAAALSVFSGAWLDRYANFMLVVGGVMVPVGGVLLSRFFLSKVRVDVDALYDTHGPYGRTAGFDLVGFVAWLAGAATYYAAGSIGGTLPSLLVAIACTLVGNALRPPGKGPHAEIVGPTQAR